MSMPALTELIDRRRCPICGSKQVGGCRCSNNVKHTVESLKQGHGAYCEKGHRWSYQTEDGKVITLDEIEIHLRPRPEESKNSNKKSGNIHLVRTKEFSAPNKETTDLILDFIKYAADFLKMNDKEIKVRLVHASPNEPITTGAYEPSTKRISTIAQNRHFIDYCRTIAHEMTHMKQDYDGKVEKKGQEIGGPIEDEANAISGQIVKSYIKNHLTSDQKKFLGLGTYGST